MSGDLVAARENSICIKLNPSSFKRKTVIRQDKRHQTQCGKSSLVVTIFFSLDKSDLSRPYSEQVVFQNNIWRSLPA